MNVVSRLAAAISRRRRYWRYLASAKRDSRDALSRAKGSNVLVLCHGNIYRSPFIATKVANALSETPWTVSSAGFHDREGRHCDPAFVEIANSYGVDLSKHRSRRATAAMLNDADLIVLMDGRNRLLLDDEGVEYGSKAVWAGAWLGEPRVDIEDPYGMDSALVAAVAHRMNSAAESLADVLQSARR